MIFMIDKTLITYHAIIFISAFQTFTNEGYFFTMLFTRLKIIIDLLIIITGYLARQLPNRRLLAITTKHKILIIQIYYTKNYEMISIVSK